MTKFNRQRFSRRLDGIELKENLVVARKGVERDQHVQNDDGAQNILHLIFHFPEVDGLPDAYLPAQEHRCRADWLILDATPYSFSAGS